MKLNVIFLFSIPFPIGMAGTKRNQHAIDILNEFPVVSLRVIILRQSSKNNLIAGLYDGIPYETVAPDAIGLRLICSFPLIVIRTMKALKKYFKPNQKNILHVYGPPKLDNILPVIYAKKIGYKVIFDIVEDDDLASVISSSISHKIQNKITTILAGSINKVANGIIVISSHLEKKFRSKTNYRIPIHFRTISVDIDLYIDQINKPLNNKILFYSGSYGIKDGVENLITAFEIIASKHNDIDLIMVGKGENLRMEKILNKINQSEFSDRIFYKGYVEDDEYYQLLNSCSIPCMTRIDLAYAHAGFPFKLGEFLAAGKPVIVSRVSDVEALLENYVNAMIVTPGKIDEIVEAVEFLISNPEESYRIGRNAQGKAQELFDFRAQGNALFDFLVNL